MNIGEAKVAAGVPVGKPRVVKSQEVQNRRVKIVDVHPVLGDGRAELIGAAVYHSPFDAAARQP